VSAWSTVFEAIFGCFCGVGVVCLSLFIAINLAEKNTIFHLLSNANYAKHNHDYVAMKFKTFVNLYRVLQQKEDEIKVSSSWICADLNYPPTYCCFKDGQYNRTEYVILFPSVFDYICYRHLIRGEMKCNKKKEARRHESEEGYKVILKDLEAERDRHRKAEEDSIKKAKDLVNDILQNKEA